MRSFIWTVVVAGLATAARADLIISNLSSTDTSQSADLNDGRIKAMGFEMGGSEFQLESIVLRLNLQGADIDPLVRLYDDVGGVPGSLVDTLVDPASLPLGISDLQFTPSGSVTLAANTRYWVVVYNLGTSTMDWRTSSVAPSGPHATHVGGLFNATGGPNPPTTNSTLINVYEVNGSEAGDCACLANLTASDCATNTNDFFAFLALYQAGSPAADFSPGGGINTNDFFAYLAAYQADLNNPDCPG